MKVRIVEKNVEVELLHQGFDIVIIQHDNGKQECLSCVEVGLKNRDRPTKFRLY